MRYYGVVGLLFLGIAVAGAQTQWISADDYGAFQIVVADNADANAQEAATQFQHYWKACTGEDIAISNASSPGRNVWIGAAQLPDTLAAAVDLTGLINDGVLIRTLSNGDLLVTGAQSLGTLNAVYEFFERFMGVRWLTPNDTYIPEAPPAALDAIDYRYVPPFRFRWTNGFGGPTGAATIPFRQAHRTHEPRWGGGYGHNFYNLVPPPKYFPEHPEYFGMNEEGQRVALDDEASYNAPWSKRDWDRVYQLCMSNPNVADAIMDTLRTWHPKYPDADFFCVMQEDTDHHCLCPECKAIDEREGTPMGSMLTGINRVADAFAKEFPDSNLLTYAYAYTRHPPKTMKPRENVFVQLCTIECNFLHPFGPDSTGANAEFFQDLKGWSKLTDRLLTYDYAPNFANWMLPHPNFGVIIPNLRTYAENGAIGCFVQADPQGSGSMEPLRVYLISQGLWNPNIDSEATRHEFVRLYYGQAAPYIEQYIDLMTQAALAKDADLNCFDQGTWIDPDFVDAAMTLIHKAMDAAESDTVRQRVRAEWLRLQFTGLVCKAHVKKEDGAYLLTRPAEVDSAEFYDWCQKLGIRQLDEEYGRSNVPLKENVEEHLGDLGKKRPQERYDILTLENNRYIVEIAPALAGAIVRFEDKEHQRDAFRAGDSVASNAWLFQEWNTRNPNQPNRETALPMPYTVVAQSYDSVTLETELPSGIVLRRTTTLPAGNAPLDVTWEIRNPGDAPAAPYFKVHPEFWAMGENEPEIWVERDGKWGKAELSRASAGYFGGAPIESEGVTRIAAVIPQERQTVTVKVNPEELDLLFYFFNTQREHVNLELIPKQAPLAPGEVRTIHAQYSLSRRLP